MARLVGTSASNRITGTSRNDQLIGAGGNDTLNGGSGNDFLDGGTGNDSLIGGLGLDTLLGGVGNDALNGGDGNDTYRFANGFGDDVITDSSGIDTLNFSAVTAALTVNLAPANPNEVTLGTSSINWSSPTSIENVVGGSGADTITGNFVNNRLEGGAGADTLFGEAGSDTLLGGAGNDSIDGGFGNDVIFNSDGADTIQGGFGNDTYIYTTLENANGTDGDVITDLNGIDTLDFSAITESLFVFLEPVSTDGVAPLIDIGFEIIESASTLEDIENVITGSGNDTIDGNASDNVLRSGTGDDTLSGGAGNDTLLSESGDDTVFADAGNDLLIDAVGNDSYFGNTGDDTYLFNTLQTDTFDTLFDASGTGDNLRFIGLNANDVVMTGLDTDSNSHLDALKIYVVANNWTIQIGSYFNNASGLDPDAATAGFTLIENIGFDDDPLNAFADIQAQFLI
jgi:Ca2+-binding RTX toxin-like protein